MYCNTHMMYMYASYLVLTLTSINLICSCFVHEQQHAHLELWVRDIPVMTGACGNYIDEFTECNGNLFQLENNLKSVTKQVGEMQQR